MLRPTLQRCLGRHNLRISAWFFRFLKLRLVRWRKGVWVSTVSANGGQRTSSFVLDSVKDEAIPRKCGPVKSNFVYSLNEKFVSSNCCGFIGTIICYILARSRFLGKITITITNKIKKVNQRKVLEVPSDRRAYVKALGCHQYPLGTRVIDGCQWFRPICNQTELGISEL